MLFGPTVSIFFTVQFLNRWRPVFWWSLEEVGEGSCWAEEVERAASRQNSDQHIGGKTSGDHAASTHTLTDSSFQSGIYAGIRLLQHLCL